MILTAAQVRRACALLRWGSPMLAELSGVPYEIVCTAWSDDNVEAMSEPDLDAIRSTLDRAGVRFEIDAAGLAQAVLPRAAS